METAAAGRNQLADEVNDPRLMIGGNSPPLSERLAEETQPLAARLQELATVAGTAVIIDEPSCAKVVDLIRLCQAHLDAVKRQHAEDAAPYREALEQIDNAYRPIERSLTAIIGPSAREGLRGTVTVFERKRAEEAKAARDRVVAEQNMREAEAYAARKALEERKADGSAGVADELAVLQAEDAAARLGQQAEAIRPAPVRANLGTVGTTRQIVFTITDIRKAIGYLLRSGQRNQLEEAVRGIVGRHLRAIGVNAVEHGVDLPGVEAKIERVAQVR